MSRPKKRGNYAGKNKGRGGGGGRGGRKNGTAWSNGMRQDRQEVVKQNEQFERYYNTLDIVSDPVEREQFWTALRRELPNSFRFCGSKGHALAVQRNLTERYIPQITAVKFDGASVEAPQPLPWYPAGLAWQMTTPKQIVRKFAPFAAFQKFLVSETTVGNISRQEAVSMIPPLLLDVRPGQTVLDLCAAPGSKSAQLVEMMHAGEEARIRTVVQKAREAVNGSGSPAAIKPEDAEQEADDWSDDGRATGLLVANDVDYRRAQMLVHQVKRLNSPNLIVMNHDATLFPSIELPQDLKFKDGKSRGKWLKFDRILADVPCSGDGTCRKNPGIWKDWSPSNALGLHKTQVRILVRSLQMLRVGGRVVYSTCSLNPIENEAVVSSAIERCGGLEKVHVVDCQEALPELRRKAGLKDWKVMDKEGRIWNSWSDIEDARAKQFELALERIVPGMFPLNDEYPLDRCMRVYPHQQDTGGFFITVLEKKSEIRAKPESDNKASTAASVVTIAKELESKPAEDGLIPKLESSEEYTGTAGDHAVLDNGNASAAQRQNKEAIAAPDPAPATNKRPLEEGESERARTKRARVETDDVDNEVVGEVGQMEHWPPPPTVQAAYKDVGTEVAESETPKAESQVATNGHGRRNKHGVHEEAFKYLSPAHPELDAIFSYYGLPDRFPRDRFMVRNESGEPAKAMYYTTELAKAILTRNEGRGMKFVQSGVKMFVKQDAQGTDTCRWRIQTEGLPIVEGWVGEDKVVRLYKRETLRFLLREMFPKISAPELDEVKDRIAGLKGGCSVLRIEPSDGEDGFSERIVMPLWRSVASVNLMLPKEDRKAMLLRLYNDDTPLVDHSQQIKQARDAADAANAGSAQAASLVDGDKTGGASDDEEEGGVELASAGAAVGTEDDVLAKEDRLKADLEVAKEEQQVVDAAPERSGEDDAMNTTV